MRESGDLADEITVEAVALLLLRRRRWILTLGFLGAALAVTYGLLNRRVYESSATFIPQSANSASLSSGLALAASQFGLQMPLNKDVWGPQVYVELSQSRDLLEPLLLDTVVIAEENGRRAAVIDLLEKVKKDLPEPRRRAQGVAELRKWIDVGENKRVGGVDVTVTTPWASVSHVLAERVLDRVNEFNVVTRKSQAAEERRFADEQANAAERALLQAEDQLQAFQQRNRATNSPNLRFEQDRLQREVTLRQQVYTSLVQNREEARLREVRDTPVLSILKSPVVAATPKRRRLGFKAIVGAVTGGIVAVLAALVAAGVAAARSSPREETRELIQLMQEATPRFLRRLPPG